MGFCWCGSGGIDPFVPASGPDQNGFHGRTHPLTCDFRHSERSKHLKTCSLLPVTFPRAATCGNAAAKRASTWHAYIIACTCEHWAVGPGGLILRGNQASCRAPCFRRQTSRNGRTEESAGIRGLSVRACGYRHMQPDCFCQPLFIFCVVTIVSHARRRFLQRLQMPMEDVLPAINPCHGPRRQRHSKPFKGRRVSRTCNSTANQSWMCTSAECSSPPPKSCNTSAGRVHRDGGISWGWQTERTGCSK